MNPTYLVCLLTLICSFVEAQVEQKEPDSLHFVIDPNVQNANDKDEKEIIELWTERSLV